MNFLKNAFVVSFFTLISRIFGFVRDIFFAKYLGTGYLSDIFFTAFKLPNFFRNIFAEGAFNSAFIPIFSSNITKDDKATLEKFTRNIFTILLYFLLIFTLIIEISMPFVVKIIAPGFIDDYNKYQFSITLCRITFPYLIFISLVSFLSGILNSLNKFACVSICPIILNLSFIFFSILSSFTHINVIYLLSYAVLVGGILQLLWLFYFTIKNKIFVYPVYLTIDNKVKEFFQKFSTSFIGSGVTQINSMVDAIMASTIAGAVSYIYYSDRIVQLPLSLIGTALSISILPNLSKAIQLNNKNEIKKIEENSIFIALFIGLPCAFGLFMISDHLIPILFERGKFLTKDSLIVVSLLKIYVFSLPLFILTKILQTIFYANKDTKTPMYISIVSLLINITFNLILMKFFSFKGIIISTLIASFSNVFLLYFIAKKQRKIHFSTRLYKDLYKIVFSLFFMCIFIYLSNLMIPIKINSLFLKLLRTFTIVGIASVVYLFCNVIFGTINKKRIVVLFKK